MSGKIASEKTITLSGKINLPKDAHILINKDWDTKAQILWAGGNFKEALKVLEQEPIDKKIDEVFYQHGYYLFLQRQYSQAVEVLEKGHQLYPKHIDILHYLTISYLRGGNFKKVIDYGKKLASYVPYLANDLLAHAYAELEQYDKAKVMGNRSLRSKDLRYNNSLKEGWELPDVRPSVYTKDKKKVISFSLFGNKIVYLRGALRNLLLANDLYPDWELWFWLDDSVPQEFQNLIVKLGGVVKKQPKEQEIFQKLSWRFLVSDDKDVGYFLVRDVDAVISLREVQAVAQWLASDKYFHVMRDWWSHTDLILAGMWGGVANILPNMAEAIEAYWTSLGDSPNTDQWFLGEKVWLYVRTSLMSHDRCFDFMSSRDWPEFPKVTGREHVGMNEFATDEAKQELMLAPWIKEYPCLQAQKAPAKIQYSLEACVQENPELKKLGAQKTETAAKETKAKKAPPKKAPPKKMRTRKTRQK
ncbi:MAG: tetratricopeptide repeat protein [Alphaproteobacteria bacterium]